MTPNDTPPAVPAGYMMNAAGHLVPHDQVREQDLLRDQVARELAQEALTLNSALASFKRRALGDIADLVRIAGERYDVKLGGTKGNVTVTTYDGEFKIQRAIAERLEFTEELEAAKELINGCIQMKYNLDEDHVTSNEDIRKAILYAINQDEVVAVKNGLGGKAYTAMTMLKNDNDLIPDPSKVQEHLNNYYASLGK